MAYIKKSLCILLLLLTSSCSGYNNKTSSDTTLEDVILINEPNIIDTIPDPAYGGIMTISMRRPATLNPLLNTDITVDRMLSLVFEPLFNLNQDFSLSSNIASSYEISEDRLSALITLNHGMYWSDGALITADDIVFSVEQIKKASSKSIYKHCAANITAVQKESEYTARVYFDMPKIGMENNFIFPLIPEHYYRYEETPGTARNMTPVGNGAFYFVSYRGDELLLKATPGSSRPYFDSVKIIISPDTQTDIHLFNQGITDMLAVNYGAYNRFPSIRPLNLTGYSSGIYDFIGFNFQNNHLQNKALRAAIAHSFDTRSLVNGAYLGLAGHALSPVHPNSWLLAPELIEYEYNPAHAAQLVSSAFDGDDPPTLLFRLLTNEENRERVYITQKLQESLTALGIETRLLILPFEEYSERLKNLEYDIVVGGFNLSFHPDLEFAFHSEGEGNIFAYSDEGLDISLHTARTAQNDLVFYTSLADAQRHINSELVVISLVFRDDALLTSADIYGVDTPAPNNIFSNVRQWYYGDISR